MNTGKLFGKWVLKTLVLAIFCQTFSALAISPAVRVKDIASVKEARSNQLVGFGLVVGLRNSGDSNKNIFTMQALANLLAKMGMPQNPNSFKTKNVAAVVVTAELPSFLKSGQKLDVHVASIGDATSLKGGSLVQTPLQGADGNIYAVAQGSVDVEKDADRVISKRTSGKVIQGALVEKEVPVNFLDKGAITITLLQPDFTTATRLIYALERAGFDGVRALDAASIRVPVTPEDQERIVEFVARIEELLIIPDGVAKVVVNQRTGTVVIGENVRLAPVAVTHGDLEIIIQETVLQPKKEENSKLLLIQPGDTLSQLVEALNSIKVSPRDLISILETLKAAGALKAELEVI